MTSSAALLPPPAGVGPPDRSAGRSEAESRRRRRRTAALALAALAVMPGCARVGPEAIRADRAAYGEVISRTADEELLRAIVGLRYDESFGMLSVESITASLRFRASAGAQVGFGDAADYAGNLVPLEAGVAYEENPTISYVPLSGETYARRILGPIPLRDFLLLDENAVHPEVLFALAVRSVNGVVNADAVAEEGSVDFGRLAGLYAALRRAGVLRIASTDPGDEAAGFVWYVDGKCGPHAAQVRAFLSLLQVRTAEGCGAVVLPLRQAVGPSPTGANIQLRSAYQVLRALGTFVEVPAEHVAAGLAEPPAAGRLALDTPIRVRTSTTTPPGGSVATRYRGRWFYVDETDGPSKRVFASMGVLVAMRLADSGGVRAAPVLTVPVN